MKIKDLRVGDFLFIRDNLGIDCIYGGYKYYNYMHSGIARITYISDDHARFKVNNESSSYSLEMIDWDKTMHLRYMENLSGVHDEEDSVHNPFHYGGGGKHNIECYKAIEYILDNLENVPEKYFGHVSNIVKYVWRCNDKNGYEDLDKASVYFDFMFREED